MGAWLLEGSCQHGTWGGEPAVRMGAEALGAQKGNDSCLFKIQSADSKLLI